VVRALLFKLGVRKRNTVNHSSLATIVFTGLALGAIAGGTACSSTTVNDTGSRLLADATVDSSGGKHHMDAIAPNSSGGTDGTGGGHLGGAGGGHLGGAGGAAGDGSAGPSCTVSLDTFVCGSNAQPHSARCCAKKYDDILAPGCSSFIGEHPQVQTCGHLRLFTYGHDGSQSCTYDLSTGDLVGAESCGAPPLYSSDCPCTREGQTVTGACSEAVVLCTADAATD
jgi:hypothetical protein